MGQFAGIGFSALDHLRQLLALFWGQFHDILFHGIFLEVVFE